ncbi:unnamed protein product (macronuclear) [Paramecium tetraurelia]|uniref:Clusterin-associated protein 1 n=1 Tax=Paramecium tetraurelia TaxID=5888 RepID=A0BPJ7_PARTE|nr:uncharacterized protein GSPATT00005213001 [Paramecium tetraurelia]CAK60464.1 unnamed protein product [Paramecium tetraurelia]|eukprot:XP_001427862.1 hypothetical protein (macronuclear) [Paramecium tetraurelia strain d4-2]
MSYRELRNFCEQMRALGYHRIISMENFRRPNFELVADILFWLAQKYDPNSDISDNIDEERHRVEFIKQITTLFVSKARLKINPKRLYMADVYAVQEILKISTFLYKAQVSPPADEEEIHDFSLPSKLSNIKSHKLLAQEITDLATRLYDQLGKEDEVKVAREKALQFLSNVSRGGNSQSEQSQIQKCIQTILKQQDSNIQEMSKYVGGLERDQKQLEEKIKRKTKELEQAEKRLKGMTSVKPAYQEEYDRQEYELEKLYQIYVEKFRNLVYLEHVLDAQNRQAELEQRRKDDQLKGVRVQIQNAQGKELRGDDDENDEQLDQLGGDSRLQSSNKEKRNNDFMRNQQGGFNRQQMDEDGGEDVDDIDDIEGGVDDDEEEEDEDDGIENLDDDNEADF